MMDQVQETMTKANHARDKIVHILDKEKLTYLEGMTALGIVMAEMLASMPEEMGRTVFASLSQTILRGAYPGEEDGPLQ